MKRTRLRLEFAPHARQVSRLGVAMLLISVIALGAGAIQLAQLLSGNGRQAATLAALEARRAGAATGPAPSRAPEPGEAARARAVAQVAQNLMTPWADLLESLEAAPTRAVALLSVEPSVPRRSIRLTAEARSTQDMLAYWTALQRDHRLSAVVLVSHQVQVQSPGSPVRFQIQAHWGAAP